MPTTVVNVNHTPIFDVYIGRGRDPRTGLPGKWGNPFSVEKYGREEALRLCREEIRRDAELRRRIRAELRGKSLGCFCAPERDCHGHIYAIVAETDDDSQLPEDLRPV